MTVETRSMDLEEWKDRKNIIYADYSTLDNLA